MTGLWKALGTFAFWVSWPLIYIYLHLVKRTRILVVCGDQVLVVKNWLGPNEWNLPGGGLHAGESAADGARRELREETGIDQVAVFLHTKISREHGLKFSYHVFIVHLGQTIIPRRRSLETTEIKWFNGQELLTQPLANYARCLIKEHLSVK